MSHTNGVVTYSTVPHSYYFLFIDQSLYKYIKEQNIYYICYPYSLQFLISCPKNDSYFISLTTSIQRGRVFVFTTRSIVMIRYLVDLMISISYETFEWRIFIQQLSHDNLNYYNTCIIEYQNRISVCCIIFITTNLCWSN